MADYKDRLKEECRELSERIHKLERFLRDKRSSEWPLHFEQLHYMKQYRSVLVARCLKEQVPL